MDYVLERKQFGKPLFDQDMTVEIEALRSITYQTAWQADHGNWVLKYMVE